MRLKRWIALLATVIAGSTVGLLTAGSPSAGATSQQITLLTHTGVQDYNKYFQPTANQPDNYVSPHNYRDGRLYMRLDVIDKPSSKNVIGQLCFWRHAEKNWQYETCTSTKFNFSDEGRYYVDQGSPGTWWKLNGVYDWTKKSSVVRFMLKDPISKQLLFSQNCGQACYPDPVELLEHVPVQMRLEVIMVAKGSSFDPPTTWQADCPKTWSSKCQGSGSTTTTTSATTTTTKAATTTTAASATTTTAQSATTTAAPAGAIPAAPAGGGAKIVVIAGSLSASGDRPVISNLEQLGYQVEVKRVDTLQQSDLDGAAAALITSSIVPSALPAWVKDLAVPMLVSEAYVMDDLGKAYSSSDGAARTSIVLEGSHPITAGVTGQVATSASSKYAIAAPGPGADVVATAGGKVVVYAYEAGSTMANGTAPARRVGWFYSYDTPLSATADAQSLLGHAMAWLVGGGTTPAPISPASSAPVILVTNHGNLASGDRPIASAMEAAGYEVTVVEESLLTVAQAEAARAIVISSSVLPNEVPTFLASVATPLLVSEAYVLDDLGMATGVGERGGQTKLVISGGHPATGALNGITTVASATAFNVGTPSGTANVLATTTGGAPSIFAYEAGAAMVGGTVAPAKRLGFFMSYDGAKAANANGQVLLQNALAWLVS